MSDAPVSRAAPNAVGGLATGMAAGLTLGFTSFRPGPLPRTSPSSPEVSVPRSTPAPPDPPNRRDLAPEFVRTVVRSGFNNMFPISRGEVSDAQLERIISHLTQEKAE